MLDPIHNFLERPIELPWLRLMSRLLQQTLSERPSEHVSLCSFKVFSIYFKGKTVDANEQISLFLLAACCLKKYEKRCVIGENQEKGAHIDVEAEKSAKGGNKKEKKRHLTRNFYEHRHFFWVILQQAELWVNGGNGPPHQRK